MMEVFGWAFFIGVFVLLSVGIKRSQRNNDTDIKHVDFPGNDLPGQH